MILKKRVKLSGKYNAERLLSALVFAFSLFLFDSSAQETQISWSDSKLKLIDFAGSPVGSTRFQFKYDLVYANKHQKAEKTIHDHGIARAVFIPEASWIVSDSLQETRLRYCNVVFDFVELYARRATDEINVTENVAETKNATMQALNDIVAMLARDTKMGTDQQRIAFWEHHIDSVLRMTFRKEIPDYKYSGFTMGYYWGGAYNHLTGNLGAQYSSPVSVANGIYISWKRVMYAVQATFLGRSKPSKAYESTTYGYGDSARFLMSYGNLVVGYSVIQKPQFILTPYAGLSTMRFYLKDLDPATPVAYDPLKISYNLGLAMDFRSQAFYQSNKMQFRYGLSLRANYSPYEYLPKLDGNCLSFTIGCTIYIDGIKNYL